MSVTSSHVPFEMGDDDEERMSWEVNATIPSEVLPLRLGAHFGELRGTTKSCSSGRNSMDTIAVDLSLLQMSNGTLMGS